MECCHYCFCEAGAFHPDSVGILSKALGYRGSGESFCFLPLTSATNSSCEVSLSLHPPPTIFSVSLGICFYPVRTCSMGLSQVSSLMLFQLPWSPAFKVLRLLFLSFACFQVWNFTHIHFCTYPVMLLLWAFHPWVFQFLLPSWLPVATLHPQRNWRQLPWKLIPCPFVILGWSLLRLQGARDRAGILSLNTVDIWGWSRLSCDGLSCSVLDVYSNLSDAISTSHLILWHPKMSPDVAKFAGLRFPDQRVGSSFSWVQSLGCIRLLVTPWTAACQASLSVTNSRIYSDLMSIKSVMSSNHLILCRPLLLPPSIFPSIRVFSSESVLRIRWPKYWSFSFSISPSKEYSGLISFRMDGLDLLASH